LFDASAKTKAGPTSQIAGYTLFATSPKKKHYSEFRKYVQENRLYMPVWDEDEVTTYANLTIPSASACDEVQECFRRFGGIARYLFASSAEYSSRLLNSIQTCKISDLRLSLGGLDALDDVSHMIVHYDVDSSFKSVSMRFASKFVEDAVNAEMVKSCLADWTNFIFTGSVGKPSLAAIRGSFFESFSHGRLPRGGTFAVRALASGSVVGSWQIPVLQPSAPFDKVAGLDVRMATYATPTAKNFAALDSFAQYDAGFYVGFQMTVASSHSIKAVHLCNVLKKLGFIENPKSGAMKFRIIFVVPPDVFGTFITEQSFLGADGKSVLVNIPPIISKNCVQFVLELRNS